MDWRSIVEPDPPPEQTILLRGIVATEPECYGRFYGRRRLLTLGAVALFLHRLIAWSIAAMAHLAVAFALMSVYISLEDRDESLLWASLYKGNAGDEGKLVEMTDLDVIREAPETPEPEPPTPEAPPDMPPAEPSKETAAASPSTEPPPVPSPDPVAGMETETPKPATLGAGASAEGAPPPAEVTARQIEKDPAGAVRARRAGDLKKLQAGNPRDILVVAGTYDRVEDVLRKLGIPHRVISTSELPRADLSETLILLIDCAEAYAAFAMKAVNTKALEKQIATLEKREKELEKQIDRTGDRRALYRLKVELMAVTSDLENCHRQLGAMDFPGRAVDKVRGFVKGGGYLFTSDWGLTLLELAFPGHVQNGGTVGPKTVGIQPGAGREGHALLEEVFLRPARGSTTTMRKFRWEIDSSSYLVKVEKSSVETLVESPELPRHRAVAVTFSPEKDEEAPRAGKVLHILSHFQRQATHEGDYALQNMLLNFLLDRVRPR